MRVVSYKAHNVSAAELMAELDAAQAYNAATGEIDVAMAGVVEAAQACQDRIAEEKTEIEELKAEIARREVMIVEQGKAAEECHRKFGELQDLRTTRVAKDADAIKRRIQGCGEVNAKVRENKDNAAAKQKVEHLSARADDLTAEKSQRLLLSTRIGMALNPTLRLLVCQDGGDLGNGTLDELLKTENFQMVLELVTRSDADEERCAVVIENGTSRKK